MGTSQSHSGIWGATHNDNHHHLIATDFAFRLPVGSVDEKARDLADHLLSVVISSASPTGCTSDEIRDWVFLVGARKPVAAFREFVRALHVVLSLHPGASTFLADLLFCLDRADEIRIARQKFRGAQKFLATMGLERSVGLFGRLGIPEYLHCELKKGAGDRDWFPPIGLLRSAGWMGTARRTPKIGKRVTTAEKSGPEATSTSSTMTGQARVRALFEAQVRGRPKDLR